MKFGVKNHLVGKAYIRIELTKILEKDIKLGRGDAV